MFKNVINYNLYILFSIIFLLSVIFILRFQKGNCYLDFGRNTIKNTSLQKYVRWLLIFLIFSLPLWAVIIVNSSPDSKIVFHCLRYPIVQKWVSLLFVAPKIYYQIALYRIIPFLSSIFIGWFFFYKFNNILKNSLLSFLLSLSVITLPLINYYSTLLYLEMPIVLLMLISIFDIDKLLYLSPEELKKRYSWYALLLLAFLKETVFAFLAFIALLRLFIRIRNSSYKLKELLEEFILVFYMFIPLVIYLSFRYFFLAYRQYGLNLKSVVDLSSYVVLFRALFEQLGIFFLLGLMGIILMIKKKEKRIISLIIILTGVILFFLIDDPRFSGYARWNLYLFPFIAYLVFYFISFQRKKIIGGVIVPAVFISNILFSGVSFDGIHYSNWGSPRVDTGEYIYPYRETIEWLSKKEDVRYLLLFGHYYPYYGLFFYLHKYNFYPFLLELKLTKRLSLREERKFFYDFFYKKDKKTGHLLDKVDTIIYHSINRIALKLDILYGENFKLVKKIDNKFNVLYIFRKIKILNKQKTLYDIGKK